MQSPKLRFKADDGSEYPALEEMKLGDIGSVAMCKRVYKAQTSTEGDVPFFKIGTFGGEPDAFISRELYENLRRKYSFPAKGTVLLSASGTIGRQVVYNGEDAYYQDSNIVWLDHDNTVIDDFLRQFYNVVTWQGLEGSTIKRLYNKMILETPFNRPCFLEQHKIANLLSSVDEIIAAQQAEVEGWKVYKHAVVQRLLSQQVRFKADKISEYPAWEKNTLGELGAFTKGASLSKADISADGTPLILYGELYTTYDEVAYRVVRRTKQNVDDKFLSHVGDVLIPTSGETAEEIATATCVMQKGVVLAGDLYVYRTTNKLDGRIASYLLNHQVGGQISSLAQGKSVVHVQVKELEKISVCYPASFEEQQKIADCLSSFDEVIAKARAELEQWRLLKKGLLQQMFV